MGVVRKGEMVLSFLTGGVGSYSGKQAVNEFEIKKEDDLNIAIKHYIDFLK